MFWTKLGSSVAIIAVFSVMVVEFFFERAFYQQNKFYISSVLIVLGIGLSLIGFWRLRRQNKAPSEASQEGTNDAQDKSLFVLSLSYWGLMILTLGIIVAFVRPWKNNKPTVVQAKAAPLPQTNALSPTLHPAPASLEFPPMKLRGIIFTAANRCALINGATFYIGDHIGGAEVMSIERETVVVRMGLQVKQLKMN